MHETIADLAKAIRAIVVQALCIIIPCRKSKPKYQVGYQPWRLSYCCGLCLQADFGVGVTTLKTAKKNGVENHGDTNA